MTLNEKKEDHWSSHSPQVIYDVAYQWDMPLETVCVCVVGMIFFLLYLERYLNYRVWH